MESSGLYVARGGPIRHLGSDDERPRAMAGPTGWAKTLDPARARGCWLCWCWPWLGRGEDFLRDGRGPRPRRSAVMMARKETGSFHLSPPTERLRYGVPLI